MKQKWTSNANGDTQPPMSLNIVNESSEAMGGDIKVVDNKILFYADIDGASVLELNKILLEVDLKLQHTKLIFGDNFKPVCDLRLATWGGEIMSAFSTVDIIRNMKSEVHTYVDGGVASAGTFMSVVGKKRYMGKHSSMLIHELSSEAYGKFTEIEDEYQNLAECMKMIKKFYKEYTKIPMKKLDELLKHDIWLTPQECLEYGMVDEII